MKTLTAVVNVAPPAKGLLGKAVYWGGAPACRRKIGDITAVSISNDGEVRMTFRIFDDKDYDLVKKKIGDIHV